MVATVWVSFAIDFALGVLRWWNRRRTICFHFPVTAPVLSVVREFFIAETDAIGGLVQYSPFQNISIQANSNIFSEIYYY